MSKKTVTFSRPFFLDGVNEVLPAGAYCVATDDGIIPGDQRLSTLILVHAKPGHPGLTRMFAIDALDLAAALKRDQAPEEIPIGWIAGQQTANRKTGSVLRGGRPSRHKTH